MGKQHSDHHWLPAWPEALLGSLPCASQGLYPAAGSVSFSSCAKGGRDGGTRRLSILQASADTQGRLIHCPNPPPIAAWKCLSCKNKCLFARARQEGCILQSGKVSTPCVGAQRPHTLQPYLPRNHIIPFPPEKPSGPPARQAAHQLRGGCDT